MEESPLWLCILKFYRNYLNSLFWSKQDQLIQYALVGSLSPEIVAFAISSKTFFDVWQYLSKTYAKLPRAQLMIIWEIFSKASKVTQSITSYLQFIKHLCDQFVVASSPLDGDEIALHIFNGLPSEYESLTDSLCSWNTPISFDEIYAKLVD